MDIRVYLDVTGLVFFQLFASVKSSSTLSKAGTLPTLCNSICVKFNEFVEEIATYNQWIGRGRCRDVQQRERRKRRRRMNGKGQMMEGPRKRPWVRVSTQNDTLRLAHTLHDGKRPHSSSCQETQDINAQGPTATYQFFFFNPNSVADAQTVAEESVTSMSVREARHQHINSSGVVENRKSCETPQPVYYPGSQRIATHCPHSYRLIPKPCRRRMQHRKCNGTSNEGKPEAEWNLWEHSHAASSRAREPLPPGLLLQWEECGWAWGPSSHSRPSPRRATHVDSGFSQPFVSSRATVVLMRKNTMTRKSWQSATKQLQLQHRRAHRRTCPTNPSENHRFRADESSLTYSWDVSCSSCCGARHWDSEVFSRDSSHTRVFLNKCLNRWSMCRSSRLW